MTFVSRTSWVLPCPRRGRPRTELRMLPYSRPFTTAELGGTPAHARMATACPSSRSSGYRRRRLRSRTRAEGPWDCPFGSASAARGWSGREL